MTDPQPMTPAQATEFRRRRQGRNTAVLVLLLLFAALLFAVTLAKMTHA